ncbi:ABC transporter ATP-binding protein [Nakamurella antarctica]|uniref:ABC transporter ATP-binding protein n=1 Tax=Nakamurella antarctica TaxID=1902245 RepID=A0A3G8ZY63_9ACTN|nr:ABC transporter ATP-binding protein [Nakamurella antarctica]AZI58966.1 ABC transporter ATP-binding protein [Nakamurella antarctica]
MTATTRPHHTGRCVLSAQGLWLNYLPAKYALPDDDVRWVLKNVSVQVREGEFLALVGINGCGKSSLLQALSGLMKAHRGEVTLDLPDEQPARLADMSRRSIARRIATMHQVLPPMPGVTVTQLVDQGQYPHRGALAMLGRPSGGATAQAIAAVGMTAFAHRALDSLSGGERQRARLALALAQKGRVLLLDEPTAHLDIRHQLEMLSLIRDLQRSHGLTVVMVIHDLDQAARFADRIVALTEGQVSADGRPEDVLTSQLLAEVFGVRGRVERDKATDRLHCFLDEPVSPGVERD